MSEDISKFTEEVLSNKIFNCSICEHFLLGPIFIVQGFGSICEDCRAANQHPGVRHPDLEFIRERLHFPCKFASQGCLEKLNPNALEEHQASCEFRPRKCLMGECNWQGVWLDFIPHCTTVHPSDVISNNRNSYSIELKNGGPSPSTTTKLLRGSKDCLISVKKDSSYFYYTVCDLRGPDFDYDCFIEHLGKGGKIEVKCQVCSTDDIFEGAKISRSAVREVTRGSDILTVQVKVGPLAETENINKIKDSLVCSICQCLMRAPIFQCNRGHSVCGRCRPMLGECPYCKSSFGGNIRNYSLEHLTAQIKYPCMYRSEGCQVELGLDEIEGHEAECGAKPLPKVVPKRNVQELGVGTKVFVVIVLVGILVAGFLKP